MSGNVVAKHQLAGVDDRERGFSRLVIVDYTEGRYRASLRYEATAVDTGGSDDEQTAMHELIHALQHRGYQQLKSQRSFEGEAYLGSREPWIEYPDPATPPSPSGGIVGWIRQWFGR